jgi:general stress protein 26
MTDQEFVLLLTEVANRAYLTTVGEDGYPRTRAIMNLRNPSLFPKHADLFAAHRRDLVTYVSTNTSSAKVRQVERNPRGCIYYCHPTRWRGVALIGDLEVLRDAELRRSLWNDGDEIYYPQGIDDPDYSVIALRPRWVEGWTGDGRMGFEVGAA